MVAFKSDVFETFMAEEDNQPVAMLNLLRFEPEGGRARYLEYLRMARPILERFGASILFGGEGLPVLTTGDAPTWDAVVLVKYADRSTFKAMVADPEYQRAFAVGQSAIADIALQPIKPNADLA